MSHSICVTAFSAACAFVAFSDGNLGTRAFARSTSEPLSRTYRVTRADDVEFQSGKRAQENAAKAVEEEKQKATK